MGYSNGSEDVVRVEVYWNIRRKLFSIRAFEGPDKGRVIDHDRSVSLRDATFHVSDAGRRRVIREGRKNVHAVVRGTLAGYGARPLGLGNPVEIRYNPMHDKGFHHEGRLIEKASWVILYRSGRAGVIAAYEAGLESEQV